MGMALVFFTMTLEFVFAASDLIEAGWNPKIWPQGGHYHPFDLYLNGYQMDLEKLKSSIKSSN